MVVTKIFSCYSNSCLHAPPADSIGAIGLELFGGIPPQNTTINSYTL